jgi:hypothetical protein
MRTTNMAVPDYHDFINAISPHPAKRPGHVSFDVVWHPRGRKQRIRDTQFGFVGDFFGGEAHIDFKARVNGVPVVYTSNPGGQKTIVSGVGRERNGVFFR